MYQLQENLIEVLSHIERVAHIIRRSSGLLRAGDGDIIINNLLFMNNIIRESLPLKLTNNEIDGFVRDKQKHLNNQERR